MNNKNTLIHRHIHKHIYKHLHKHIAKHGHKKIHRYMHIGHHFHHLASHIGELIIVAFISLLSFMHASSGGTLYGNLNNNISLTYPVQRVSTLECRTLERETMPSECKIKLPLIYGNNSNKYKGTKIYRDLYTVLWAANYTDTRDQRIGAHAGIDIASAKGTPLYSIGDGEIYFAGWNNGYGNVVKIRYKYKGEIIYATYAHMDKIHVKKRDPVAKGQQIGTIGNSGNTFGALGGYHVHFEINKESYGRPAYYYAGCPQLDKGHYQIIQNGYCREQLFTYQYDPIKLIEESLGRSSIPIEENITDNETEKDIIEAEEKEFVNEDETEELNSEIKPPEEETDSEGEELKEEISSGTEVKDPSKEDQKGEEDTIEDEIIEEDIHNSPSEDPIIDNPTEENTPEEENQNNVDIELPSTDDVIEKLDLENINLDDFTKLGLGFDELSLLSEHFLSQNNLQIYTDLETDTLDLGKEYKILIVVTDKNSNQAHKGTLLTPIKFMTNNRNLELEYKNISLLEDGIFEFTFTAQKEGDSAIIINLGNDKIFTWRLNIK